MAFLIYLDDVTNAFLKKWGLVIQDWYFGEGMGNNNPNMHSPRDNSIVCVTKLFSLIKVHVLKRK